MKNMVLNLLGVSLGTSIVIVLVILIARLAGKKFSAKWRFWIWMLLALRLLLPVELPQNEPPVSIPVPPQLVEEHTIIPDTQEESKLPPSTPAAPMLQENNIVVEMQPITPSIESKSFHIPSGLELLFLVWAVGAAGSAVWQTVSYLRWKNENKLWNHPVEDGEVLNLYHELCASQGISKIPQLMQNKRIPSPMLIGLLKPTILLPQMEYSEDDYTVVLTHELSHYKRSDLWYKLLILAARCVHWFNPLVWLMMKEADNDLEISCDELVVKNCSGEDRAFYCETILRVMCRGKGRYAVLSTGFSGGKKVLQRRFEAVLNDRASKGFVLGALSMALLIYFSSFIGFDVKEPEKPSDLPVVNIEKEEKEEIKYKAIPEELRWIGDEVEHLQPTEGQLDYRWTYRLEFWPKVAGSFLLADIELSENMTSKDIATFFNVVASYQHLCNNETWRSYQDGKVSYIVPGDDIWGVLRSHLPGEIVCKFEPAEGFNEDGSMDGPYYKAVNTYLYNTLAGRYDPKSIETVSVTEEGDIITVELVAYDMDKYCAQPQVKEAIETYRFSVRVAYDSWYLLEADITELN